MQTSTAAITWVAIMAIGIYIIYCKTSGGIGTVYATIAKATANISKVYIMLRFYLFM